MSLKGHGTQKKNSCWVYKQTYVYFISTYCTVCTSSESAGIKNRPYNEIAILLRLCNGPIVVRNIRCFFSLIGQSPSRNTTAILLAAFYLTLDTLLKSFHPCCLSNVKQGQMMSANAASVKWNVPHIFCASGLTTVSLILLIRCRPFTVFTWRGDRARWWWRHE